jgi:hypothetical protein
MKVFLFYLRLLLESGVQVVKKYADIVKDEQLIGTGIVTH